MRRRIFSFMIIVLVLLNTAVPAFGAIEDPQVDCKGAIVIDGKTQKVLYEKNSTVPMSPASLTKVMTGLLVVEKLDLNKKVTITKEATRIGGNNIGLVEGEELTVEQLLNAMMIYSANDAAVALAIETSGSTDEFVKLMNGRAKELGAKNTNFISPNGLTESAEHFTTAEDIGKITLKALESNVFRDIIKKTKYEILATNKSEKREIKATNKLLDDEKTDILVNGEYRKPKYEGAFGVKTGMMKISGWCLIAGAKKDNTEIITIALNSSKDLGRFEDSITMLDFAFNNFYTYEVMKPGEDTGKVRVKYGHETKVATTVAKGAYITLPKEGSESLANSKVVLDKKIKAPIKKGTKVGVVEIYEDKEKVGEADIVIAKDVKKGGPWTALYISDRTAIITFVIAGVILIFLIYIKSKKKKIKKKRERQRQKAREERAKAIALEREERKRRGWPY